MLKTIGAITAVIAVLGVPATLDYESALILDAIEKEQRPQRASASTLEFPLAYEVSVTQSLPSGREAVTRYYERTSIKEEK